MTLPLVVTLSSYSKVSWRSMPLLLLLLALCERKLSPLAEGMCPFGIIRVPFRFLIMISGTAEVLLWAYSFLNSFVKVS